jgi:hypothetical protein
MQLSSRFGAAQEVTVGAASAASAAFAAQTRQIRIAATSACRVVVGDGTPVATATDAYLPANTVEYVQVTPGQRIAAIQESAGGKLSVTEIT